MAPVTEDDPLVEQLMRLLDIRLLDPLEILLEGDDVVGEVRHVLRVRAEQWAGAMRGDDETQATQAVMRLITSLYPGDLPFTPPPDWWWTPFGQVVALRLGHPAESVSYATAGAMLGVSRQAVHDLVRRGRLPRHPDGGVPSEAVRERLLHTKSQQAQAEGSEEP